MLINVNKKVRGEILLAYYTCKYNLSFNFASKIPKMIANLAYDSKVIEDLNISRHKI